MAVRLFVQQQTHTIQDDNNLLRIIEHSDTILVFRSRYNYIHDDAKMIPV